MSRRVDIIGFCGHVYTNFTEGVEMDLRGVTDIGEFDLPAFNDTHMWERAAEWFGPRMPW